MKKLILLAAVLGLFCVPAWARHGEGHREWPEPMLLAPSEKVSLARGQDLEFRWESAFMDSGDALEYDFRIYKSPKQIESTLLYKTKISPRQNSINVKADLFENGRTYSWSLRLVGPVKGRKAYSLFTVTKT